ncbi:glycosyltransferase [Candidatus Dependentiae bacterium]|nr:glycosyltransferase [Candidatus Dependentiae bacterium]
MNIKKVLLATFFTWTVMPLVGSVYDPNYSAVDPLLVVLLMVKNEKDVIVPTIQSYIPQEISNKKDIAYVVCDTGSHDGTEKIAQEFFEKNDIKNFIILQDPWVDFSTSRNRALAFTRKRFPQSTFILFPDAEWYLNSMDLLIEFCRTEKARLDKVMGTRSPYYHLTVEVKSSPHHSDKHSMDTSIEFEFIKERLFLTNDDVEFEGETHECTTKCSEERVPRSIYFTLGASKVGQEKSTQRWYRDRDLLLKGFSAHPDNPRTALYLGLTEFWLGNYRDAYMYLCHRVKLSSFPEEDYFAYYKLGIVTMILAQQEPETFKWEEAHSYFLKAYSLRPHRAEPLVRIAAYYMEKDNHPVSYIYSKRAADIVRPEHEILEVEAHLYEYDRWELLSRSAWYFGDYELGEQATLKAIESRPNFPHLYRNLAFFWDKMSVLTEKKD